MRNQEAPPWITYGVLATLLVLFAYSLHLSQFRIYQVDEAQNLFMARVVGRRECGTFFTTAALWFLGPLGWLTKSVHQASQLFHIARLAFFVVFWCNLLLLANLAGGSLRHRRGQWALLAAATLAPLWDYGLEVRHDNLILLGLLASWWLWRRRAGCRFCAFLLGFLAVVLTFVAFKAIAYGVPLTVVGLGIHWVWHRSGWLRVWGLFAAGALAAFLACWALYRVSGLWPVYVAGLHGGFESASGGTRFGPGMALGRLPAQTPLLLAVTVGALWTVGRDLLLRGKKALAEEGLLPEVALLAALLASFLVNPTPFPYNLVNLVPFAFLLGMRFLEEALEGLPDSRKLGALAAGILLFTHMVPFAVSALRHLDWTNQRQELLMKAAEDMTDPVKDPVYDATGMVPTRASIGRSWYLHSLNIGSFIGNGSRGVRGMLEANPPAVIIPSYRTDWLRKEDWNFIRSRYLPLADDFWVLGQMLPRGGGPFSLVHPGRYLVFQIKDGVLVSDEPGDMDGHAVGPSPVFLEAGMHQVGCAPDRPVGILWMGPGLQQPPVLGAGDHQRLFVNWY